MFKISDVHRTATPWGGIVRLAGLALCVLVLAVSPVSALGANTVTPSPSPATITATDQCVTVSFTLTRDGIEPARGVNIRFKLDNLELCSPNAYVLGDWAPEGTYPGIAKTPLLSHGAGEYSVGAIINGEPCGPTGGGVVVAIDVMAAAGIRNDTGTITVLSTDLTVAACNLISLSVVPGPAGDVTIAIPDPAPLADLTSTQVKANNNPPPQPPTGPFSMHINFQPAAANTPTDYIADTGASYNSVRTYGWLSTVTPVERGILVDDPSDTFVKKFNSGNPAVWQIDVPNGTYEVRVGVGDALTQGTHVVVVEGTTFFDAVLTQGLGFESATHSVAVADGQLTMSIGGAHASAPVLSETKINLIEIDTVVFKTGGSADEIALLTETTGIKIEYSLPPTGDVEIYRAGYGDYPEYATGSVPTLPTYPPDPAIWTDIQVTSSPFIDRVPDRDFYYYAAFVVDGGAASTAVMTEGTLNYHLGDAEDSEAGTECVGDNLVTFLDVSKIGAHYGTVSGDALYRSCLDVAPTTNPISPIDGRPTPNGAINFSDLIYAGFNFLTVSKSVQSPAPAATDRVTLQSPGRVRAGDRIEVILRAEGAGRVQGMSIELGWDPTVVRPIGVAPGAMLEQQNGVALTPRPGLVDVTLLGARAVGLSGEGALANVQFEVLRHGDPAMRVARIEALDVRLQPVAVASGSEPDATTTPRVAAFLQNSPNPFNPSTTIVFALPQGGAVDLAVYAVDGRRIRTLIAGGREAGRHEIVWDGADERGTRVASGTYYVRLTAPEVARTLAVSLVK